ncbi:hypothetical protein [Plasmodium yoelii yoelii]|uniref:Uncharacterized protein n=1 Tax=Plasmodium yoelii yoelii TaxID=73239 RepID=Q7RNL2_PLAYO|nr:hypothetical protein [Plasmodium yoelii yoelii]
MDKIIQRNVNKKKNIYNSKFKLNIDLYKKYIDLIDKKNYPLVLNKGKNNSKENTNNSTINKFIGIFLPPKHHLLMVFQIYDKSTIISPKPRVSFFFLINSYTLISRSE